MTTRIQVSGWRFLLRRVEHAIVRRDTHMFDDPLQFYSRAVVLGVVIAILTCLGCALLAYVKPLGKRGEDALVVDRTTNQLYVVLPGTERLRPVYNLTSARLVLGHPDTPSAVKSDELEGMPKGLPIGIPAAPYATPVARVPASTWTVCDTVTKSGSVAPVLETAVLVGPPFTDAAVSPLTAGQGMLVSYGDANWLITDTGRHAIDVADRAVTSAVGIPVAARPAPMSRALFDALPDAGPFTVAPPSGSGSTNTVGLPANLVVGSVFDTVTDSGAQQYVVLSDGVAKVNGPTAAALRATDSHGLVSPPSVASSVVAKIAERVFDSPLPAEPLEVQTRADRPTLCWSWRRDVGDHAPVTTVLTGRHLPMAVPGAGVGQIDGDATVFIAGGQYVRVQSSDPRYGESLYYVDPQGVRYGLPDQHTADSLGLASPVTAPWQVLALLVDGPVLLAEAALLEHDTLPPDPDPRAVPDARRPGTTRGGP
ncbi:type VII secretion protein EccB [Mycolicibacterium madagascariense]|nr:type VII secretion protein EccB [Mycolicibacterium madagascariense]